MNESAYTRWVIGIYLPKLEKLRNEIEFHGKDFTNVQLAEMFDVSVKTFNSFYSGKLIRVDLLINLSSMYGFENIII